MNLAPDECFGQLIALIFQAFLFITNILDEFLFQLSNHRTRLEVFDPESATLVSRISPGKERLSAGGTRTTRVSRVCVCVTKSISLACFFLLCRVQPKFNVQPMLWFAAFVFFSCLEVSGIVKTIKCVSSIFSPPPLVAGLKDLCRGGALGYLGVRDEPRVSCSTFKVRYTQKEERRPQISRSTGLLSTCFAGGKGHDVLPLLDVSTWRYRLAVHTRMISSKGPRRHAHPEFVS